MRRLLPILALLAATSAANAADPAPKPVFVTKAPVVRVAPAPVPCTLTQCNVWFLGPSIMGMGSNIDIIGQGISNSVFANGGYVAGTVGAQIWNSGMFLGVENMAGWAFGAPASVNGVGVTTAGGLDAGEERLQREAVQPEGPQDLRREAVGGHRPSFG